MGNSSSMLTQYDIEEVHEHCNYLFTQQEIVALYKRFCQLDRNAKGFISADELLSIPEFSVNPLSQGQSGSIRLHQDRPIKIGIGRSRPDRNSMRLVRMVDGFNFKDFVTFLSAFSSSAPLQQKIELIFKVYDLDGKGKVTFDDILQVLRDLTGSFISEKQREQVLSHVFEEAGYKRDGCLLVADFVKILGNIGLKMEVEVPVD